MQNGYFVSALSSQKIYGTLLKLAEFLFTWGGKLATQNGEYISHTLLPPYEILESALLHLYKIFKNFTSYNGHSKYLDVPRRCLSSIS